MPRYIWLLLPFVGLCSGATSRYCSFFGNRAPSAQPGLTNCTWYKEDSCCLQEEINALFPAVAPPLGASKRCRNFVNYLMCYVCAPTQSSFYQSERLTVCKSFCTDFFSACKDATLKGQKIIDKYKTETEFCEDRKYIVSSNGESCFTLPPANRTLSDSAGGRMRVSWTVVQLCTLAGLICTVLPGGRGNALALMLLAVFLFGVGQSAISQQVMMEMASDVRNDILMLANAGLNRTHMQALYDNAGNVTTNTLNVSMVLTNIKSKLEGITSDLARAASKIQQAAEGSYATASKTTGNLDSLPTSVYQDADMKPGSSRLSLKLTYNGTFRKYVSFDQSTIKIPDNVMRSSSETVQAVSWTAGIDRTLKELQQFRNVRWSYFGSETGVFRIFPGFEWVTNFAGFRVDYDPRLRPWYLSATSGPKRMAIFLDCSESMDDDGRWEIAKEAVKQILSTLTRDDFVNIICSRGWFVSRSARYHYPRPVVLGCNNRALIRATVSNRKQLIDAMDDFSPYGSGAYHDDAVRTILDMLPATDNHCLNLLVFITDGKDNDPNTYRGVCYRSDDHGYHRYGCGALRTDFEPIWRAVSNAHTDPRKDVHVVGVMVDNEGELLPGKMACDNGGVFIKLPYVDNIRLQMNGYYSYLAQLAKDNGEVTKPTSPYVDLQGLGRVITLSRPVFDRSSKLLGVVGVDAVLDDMEAALLDEQFGLSYAFLINLEGKAIIHPQLKPSTELVDDPVYPDIVKLEQYNNESRIFYEYGKSTGILNKMMNGESGKSALLTGPRPQLKGSLTDGVKWKQNMKFTYHYDTVAGTNYAFAFVLTEDDKIQYELDEVSYMPGQGYNFYHEIKKYLPDQALAQQLGIKTGASNYKHLTVAMKRSTVKLAPKSFCDPTRYALSGEPGFTFINNFLNSNTTAVGCDSGGKIMAGIRSTVFLSQPIEEDWLGREFKITVDKSEHEPFAWTYFASSNGVWRVFPGARWPRPFDPTRRSWYHRAITNPPQDLSLSSVYLDGGGVGKVVTLAQTVFEGKPSTSSCTESPKVGGCSCNSDSDCKSNYCYGDPKSCANHQVAGVVATDIRFLDFSAYMKASMNKAQRDARDLCGAMWTCTGMNCSTECLLINDAGEVVYDGSFQSKDDGDTRSYEHVPLGAIYGNIMRDLVDQKVFNRSAFVNHQGTCQRSPYAPALNETGILLTAEEQDSFYENRGPIPRFQSSFGCEQDQVHFEINRGTDVSTSPLMRSLILPGPCANVSYNFVRIQNTNLYLLTIIKRVLYKDTFYNFNCHILNNAFRAGGFQLREKSCTREDSSAGIHTTCQPLAVPPLRPCSYDTAAGLFAHFFVVLVAVFLGIFAV